jgi:phospholipase C
MGYYKRADIPFQFALAESFTICDACHCSVFGPTWPNRMYLMTGMIDPDGLNGGPILNNKAPVGGYTWMTDPERLEAAGVSWKVYQQKDNYGCNMLKYFKAFQQAEAGSSLYSRGMQVDPDGLPIGGGFRVPCIIVSPWTAGGWVCSDQFDHTSVLQFLERFTGLREANITDWRRRTFGDLTSAFRFRDALRKPPVLSYTSGMLSLARYGAANLPKPVFPEGDQQAPKQEKGNRRRVSNRQL